MSLAVIDDILEAHMPLVEAENTETTVPEVWKKPVDATGKYDPTVELAYDEFRQLDWGEQVDYLLATVRELLNFWLITELTCKLEFANNNSPTIVKLNRDNLNPRVKNTGYGGCLANGYSEVYIQVSEGSQNYNVPTHSLIFRPFVIALLLSFLLRFKPEKYNDFVQKADSYVTNLILGLGTYGK